MNDEPEIDFDPPLSPEDGSRWHANIDIGGTEITGFGDSKEEAAVDVRRRYRGIMSKISFCPACGSKAALTERDKEPTQCLSDWSDGDASVYMWRVACGCGWMGGVLAFQSIADSPADPVL